MSNDNKEISEFIKLCKQTGTTNIELEKAEKIGIDTGLTVKHPFTEGEIPVYIANFILLNYGTGAIFGCPAHDQRDFEFAKKYNLEIKQVVSKDKNEDLLEAYTGMGKMINSDFLDGLEIEAAKKTVIDNLKNKNQADYSIKYKLRDWV